MDLLEPDADLERIGTAWRDSADLAEHRRAMAELMQARRLSRYVLRDGTTIVMQRDGTARLRRVPTVEPWRVVLGPEDLPKFRVSKGSPVTPGLPTKNAYFTVNPHTKRITSRAVIMKGLAKAIVAAAWQDTGKAPPRFERAVVLHLVQYAPKIRRTGHAVGLPLLDSDACLPAVRDALQAVGVVPDDALIVRNVCESRYRKGEPGLEIELRPA
jgi:hypothetical protein